jgi:4a-hydroxytetrahydrobiopterin dehydratase
MDLIPPALLDSSLEHLEWNLDDGALVKVVETKDFVGALAFVNAVGALAEAANHHPDIDIRWATVTLRLVTHSLGGITDADLSLAKAIDAIE